LGRVESPTIDGLPGGNLAATTPLLFFADGRQSKLIFWIVFFILYFPAGILWQLCKNYMK
jgi:hypothetical protein